MSTFPLPYDPADDRVDEDLVSLVADLIIYRTGCPEINGPDLERLRRALHWFFYRPADPTGDGFSDLTDRLSTEVQPVPPYVGGNPMTGREVPADEVLDSGCPEHGYRVTEGCPQCEGRAR